MTERILTEMSLIGSLRGSLMPKVGEYDLTIMLFGTYCSGSKTSLLLRFLRDRFISDSPGTLSPNCSGAKVKVDGCVFKVNLIGLHFLSLSLSS